MELTTIKDERTTLTKGDYVLATKYSDGDPKDSWCVGFLHSRYDHGEGVRYMVTDSDGNQFRGNGFRRVEKISSETGTRILEMRKQIDAGDKSLWDIRKSFHYLGETQVSHNGAKPQDFGFPNWVTCWIETYGGFDGERHKQWLIDQCLRISLGARVDVYIARWDDGTEETRYKLDEPSDEYVQWIEQNPDWDTGIVP